MGFIPAQSPSTSEAILQIPSMVLGFGVLNTPRNICGYGRIQVLDKHCKYMYTAHSHDFPGNISEASSNHEVQDSRDLKPKIQPSW